MISVQMIYTTDNLLTALRVFKIIIKAEKQKKREEPHSNNDEACITLKQLKDRHNNKISIR